jgi:hypothetical protein
MIGLLFLSFKWFLAYIFCFLFFVIIFGIHNSVTTKY